jgi:hypothetical protein
MDIQKPTKRPLTLGKALKIGYLRNEKKQAKALKRFGYRLDTEISDGETFLTAYNPTTNKLLYISNGTDITSQKGRSRDLPQDLLLGLGATKQTKRFDQEKSALLKAKAKHPTAKVVLAGHSLGSQMTNSIASGSDRVLNYNPAYSIGQKALPNVQNYRTAGDVFSYFAPKQNTIQLPAPEGSSLLKKHEVANIKDLPVFI